MPEQWKLLLLMQFADPETVLRMAEEHRNAKAHEEFELWAIDCPHLVFENYGNATEYICRHPDRDDPTEWVMCDINLCPLKRMNQEIMTDCKLNYCPNCGARIRHD